MTDTLRAVLSEILGSDGVLRSNRSRDYFEGSDGWRRESNRSPLAGRFLKAHPS